MIWNHTPAMEEGRYWVRERFALFPTRLRNIGVTVWLQKYYAVMRGPTNPCPQACFTVRFYADEWAKDAQANPLTPVWSLP